MATRVALKRLTLEYKSLEQNPPPYIDARPSEDNILQWYYVITGPPDTPFEGGQFLGQLTFPADYPYEPPSIRMLTPSGRFEPGQRLCLSISDYHPETWNPAWNVGTILTGLLSYMLSNDVSIGAIASTPEKIRKFTRVSVKWNLSSPLFTKHFPDVVSEIKQAIPDPDEVETIEVVPPKPSDLIAQIKSSYRGTASYEAAQITAKSALLKSAKEEAAANEKASHGDAPSAGWGQALLFASALAALIVAVLYINS